MRQPDQGRRVPSGYRTPAGWARVLRGSPATLVFVVLLWAAGALSASLRSGPPPFLLPHVTATSRSVPDHWWTLLLSAFWERDLAGYIVGTLVVLLAGLPLERRLGSLKFAVAALAGHVLGIVATLGFLAVARGLMGSWIRDLSGHFFLGPSALACAAAMAATAALSTLWRRRVRVVLLAVLLLFAMYAGGFEDLVRLGAAVAGGLLGPVLLGRRPRFGWPAVSRHEARILVALLLTVAATGPVIAGLAPHAVGPLSVLKFLFTNIQPVDPATLQASCSRSADLRDCAAAQACNCGPGRAESSWQSCRRSCCSCSRTACGADGVRLGGRAVDPGLAVPAGRRHHRRRAAAPPPGSASREGVGGIELSGYSHPLSLVLPMLVPVLLTVLLLAGRNLFPVRAPRGTYVRLARRVVAALVLLSVVYVGLGLLLATGFTPAPGLLQLLADVPDRFIPLGFLVDRSPAFFPESTGAVVLYESIGVVFWAWTGALLLRTFLRPAHGRHSADEERARRILKSHGGGSLSWMTTWSGNSYWFSGSSFIAYRVRSGVAVALGPPVGPRADREAAFTEFPALPVERVDAVLLLRARGAPRPGRTAGVGLGAGGAGDRAAAGRGVLPGQEVPGHPHRAEPGGQGWHPCRVDHVCPGADRRPGPDRGDFRGVGGGQEGPGDGLHAGQPG